MIDQQIIENIKNKADIVTVIGRYVQLKKRGRNHLGLCPFHNEKTPSFTVSQEKGIFKCFGCGKSGNVYTFLMEIEKLEFVEAVKQLGEMVGVEVKDEHGPVQKKDVTLYEINAAAAHFFQEQLINSTEASTYIQKRGLTPDAVKTFGLGYAPQSWDALINLLSKKFPVEKIAQAGLILARDTGGYYDRFRHRLMFAIHDQRGQVVAFSGRVIDPESKEPKYVNSPETPIFVKGHQLYGLYAARNAIIKEGFALVVEGQMDVIACHNAGIHTAVASLGTAFTPDQARILGRYTKKVIIAYDQDEAGQKATDRVIEILQPLGFDLHILVLPVKDPDEMIQTHGVEALRKSLNESIHYIQFQIDRCIKKYNIADRVQKSDAAREALAICAKIDNKVLYDDYLRYISQRLSIGRELLQEMSRRSIMPGIGKGNSSYTPAPTPKHSKAEHIVLYALITDPGQRQHILELLTPQDFGSEWQELLNYLQQTDAAYDNLIDTLNRDEGNPERAKKLQEQIAAIILKDEHLSAEVIEQSCVILYERRKELKKAHLREELHAAEAQGNDQRAHELMHELQTIQ